MVEVASLAGRRLVAEVPDVAEKVCESVVSILST